MAASSSGPLNDLLDLHRRAELAAQYPRVQQLVAALPRNELPQAGRLLARVDPDDVQRRHPTVAAVTVAVTGHGTLSDLVPALHAEFARSGLLARTVVSNFDSYVFDLSDAGSAVYAAEPGLVLCVLDPAVVLDELPVPWRPADVERVMTEKVSLLERLVAGFEERACGTLVLNTIPLPSFVTAQLVDHRSRARLGAIWREGNARLLALAERQTVVVVDLDPLVAEGIAVDDPRLRVYARANLSPGLLARYAREIGHLARHVAGGSKKCLALDLDGTVWGGVLGEDGIEGIEVADGRRGEAFRVFQRVAKQIGSQGVLLAAVSKNDLEPVRATLRDHPRMTLREDDFLRVAANWRPKHENLLELAEALNLGVDSFVFADDSAYECGLVRRELPGVAVVELDDEPALHAGRLLEGGWFDVHSLTAEDRARPSRYRDDLVRKDFLESFASLEGYLRELGVTVRLAALRGADVARVSQLTLRTNQFNLTAWRLQPPEVQALLDDPSAQVLTIHAADRFGDSGLVGAVLMHSEDDVLHIDNFLLSCRVFSRSIEQACLAAVLRRAAADGACAVLGTYRKTAKNGKVSTFYSRNGFRLLGDDGFVTSFRHDLREILEPPGYVELTESFEGRQK